ncbi:phosphatase PAP2 family protein [Streptomyces sp. WMMC500]|uniref:phosphatase PAP2 family protein n=1 Tax=Streptomyces sp. WMMC500 TaxID=3015154 RepID=UPI00248B6BDA|nr:phosphatase PAP2 family protein [Streptomyces sp. WMMC500]WBB64226.1 phosphatase PAP2 family protein [Streptomyces sp. WMMC500]
MRSLHLAGTPPSGSNADVSVLYDINGVADSTPPWFDRGAAFLGEYGLIGLLGVLLVVCWWRVRRRPGAAPAVAALLWGPLAAVLAWVANMPIRAIVERPRPFREHDGLEVLLPGTTGYSFVSDHTSVAMALAVGLFMAGKRYGLAGLALALLEGLSRVYLGVHYPSDVVGGVALGTSVALLLAPAAIAALVPLVRRAPDWLVGDPEAPDAGTGPAAGPGDDPGGVPAPRTEPLERGGGGRDGDELAA